MKKSFVIRSNLLTIQEQNKLIFEKGVYISVESAKIVDISMEYDKNRGEVIDMRDKIIIPGLIDVHTHLPQLPIVGSYGDTLIEWLEKYTYPAETLFNDSRYARALSKRFYRGLKQNGVTTAVIYSNTNINSTQIAFEEAEKSKLRAFIGNTMMDQNCPTQLCQSTISSLIESHRMAIAYNNVSDRNPKLNYIFSPRFAITCTQGLLEETGSLAKKTDSFIQTHLNENIDEIKTTEQLFPSFSSYTDIYHKTGLLGSKTLLAHCIHSRDEELELISKTASKIIHCPDANLFLRSGRFPIERIKDYNIEFGLGSDVGAGTTQNMFKIMKSMIYAQSIDNKYSVTPQEAFYTATLGNAKILGLEDTIGSIEVGKNAEFAVISINSPALLNESAENILSKMIFTDSITEIETFI